MEPVVTIDMVNSMSQSEFLVYFGNIIEDGKDFAEHVFLNRPFETVDDIMSVFASILETSNLEEKEIVLQKYPQLGAKCSMSKQSTLEHENAGLLRMAEQFADEMKSLNRRYLDKFGFPFVISVKNKDPSQIMECLKRRMGNEKVPEITTGIEEVKRITNARLAALFQVPMTVK